MKKIDRTGEIHITNEGSKLEIISYRSAKSCDVKFEDGSVVKNLFYLNIKKGQVRNPYHPAVYGVGYIGEGEYISSIGSKNTQAYEVWRGMLRRCYEEKTHLKMPTYIGCSVDKRWYNFQTFAKWFEVNYIIDYQLDKDILVKGNKIYSPETCVFVPQEINKLLTSRKNYRGDYPLGVCKFDNKFHAQISLSGKQTSLGLFKTPEKAFQAYKRAKEKEIKDIANLCKDILTPQTYQALMKYKVEITD